MAKVTRETLQSAIVQFAEQEKQLLIEIQKLQQNAVILDGFLESLDEGKEICCSLLPKPVVIEVKKQYTDTQENVLKRFKQALDSGNSKEVAELLQDDRIDPSINNNYAIQQASKNGHLAIVDLLLREPPPVRRDVDPSAGYTQAIRMASARGHLCVVERLLQDPRVDPSAENNEAIRWASLEGHLAVVERLLQDPRVDPSAENNNAIYSASYNGHLAIVERLLQDLPSWHPYRGSVDPSAKNNAAIRIASKNGHLSIVNRLLQDPRVDPSANNQDALVQACCWAYRGDLSSFMISPCPIVERLLQDPRVDPSVNDNLALKKALAVGFTPVIKLLIQDPRVDPSIMNNRALELASRDIDYTLMELLLLDPRVDPSTNDNCAINYAIQYNKPELLIRLLQDPRVNPAHNNNQFFYHTLMMRARVRITEILLQDPRVEKQIDYNRALNIVSRFVQEDADSLKLLKQYKYKRTVLYKLSQWFSIRRIAPCY